MLYKHGEMEEVREGREPRFMREMDVFMEVKRGLRNCILRGSCVMKCSGMDEKYVEVAWSYGESEESVSGIEGASRGEYVRWKDMVRECMHESGADRRGGIEQGRSVYVNMERNPFLPLAEVPGRNKASETR